MSAPRTSNVHAVEPCAPSDHAPTRPVLFGPKGRGRAAVASKRQCPRARGNPRYRSLVDASGPVDLCRVKGRVSGLRGSEAWASPTRWGGRRRNLTEDDHRNLTSWAENGVLLLNTALTVKANEAGSHSGKGWETFTGAVVRRRR